MFVTSFFSFTTYVIGQINPENITIARDEDSMQYRPMQAILQMVTASPMQLPPRHAPRRELPMGAMSQVPEVHTCRGFNCSACRWHVQTAQHAR